MITALDLGYIISFFATTIGALITAQDSIMLINNVSLLDVFIAIMLLEIVFAYINRLIGVRTEDLKRQDEQISRNQAESRDEKILSSMDESDDEF
jgi:hypothetical protein